MVNWLCNKYCFQREYCNTIYNIFTGYNHYNPPAEITIPPGYYFNPYVNGIMTKLPPFLKDKMIEYDDGVPASTPQMAYDLTQFLSFLKYGRIPDMKFDAAM